MTNLNFNNLFRGLSIAANVNGDKKCSNDALKNEYNMEVIAHRGYSAEAPENTISAFEAAKNNGYSTVECDVSWTQDSVPVILHDKTINRTARNSWGFRPLFPKKCSDMKYDKLLEYDFGRWFSKDFKGEKIPTFDETLEFGAENDLDFYIELKSSEKFDEKRAQALVDSVYEHGLEDNVTWISFEEDYLKEIADIMPQARLGYLSSDKIDDGTIEILDELKTDENEVFLDVKASKVDKNSADKLHDAGYDFEAWTVDDIDDIEKLYSYGCAGITTNELSDDEIYDYLKNN